MSSSLPFPFLSSHPVFCSFWHLGKYYNQSICTRNVPFSFLSRSGKPIIVSQEGPIDGQVKCVASGYPAPKISWYYCEPRHTRYDSNVIIRLRIKVKSSVNITILVENKEKRMTLYTSIMYFLLSSGNSDNANSC